MWTPEQNRDYQRQWRKDNLERCRAYNRNYRARKRTEKSWRVLSSMTARLRNAKIAQAAREMSDSLGCSLDEFETYIEGLFLPGMSWENFGTWHIDHIAPLSSFDLFDPEELAQACHFTNLQPLWAVDNLCKGASRGE